MENFKVNATAIEVENDKEHQSLSEKIERIKSLSRSIDEKAEKLDKLVIDFSEKAQEFKKTIHEIRDLLSE